MDSREKHIAENIITPQKILANLKHFWWFCVIPLVFCAVIIYRDTMSTYRVNQAAAARDTYIASALVYFPTEDEEIGKGNMVIFKSKNTMEKVNVILTAEGYAPFDEENDTLELGHTMASYGVTLIGEGEDRMLCMGHAFAESMLEVIEEATGMSGYIVDDAIVEPCMVDASGNVRIYSDVSERQVSLSLRDFLTWKKLMILCAGVFLGFALIFVAILFDQKVRSREEMEAFCQLPCMGQIGRKKEKDRKLFVSLANTMCCDRQVAKVMLLSVTKEGMLSGLAGDLEVAADKAYEVMICENGAGTAAAMTQCRSCGAVVLTVRKNVDTVGSVKKALSNLEMIQAQVLGYILTE